ncbi:hypothetical protein ACFPRL_30170 [Pseudoclavibacter helvolus]
MHLLFRSIREEFPLHAVVVFECHGRRVIPRRDRQPLVLAVLRMRQPVAARVIAAEHAARSTAEVQQVLNVVRATAALVLAVMLLRGLRHVARLALAPRAQAEDLHRLRRHITRRALRGLRIRAHAMSPRSSDCASGFAKR